MNSRRHCLAAEGTRQELIYGAADTVQSATIDNVNGLLHEVDLEIPNWTNNVTAVLAIVRPDGRVAYESQALARNSKAAVILDRPVSGREALRVNLSGDPGGAGGNVWLTPVYKRYDRD